MYVKGVSYITNNSKKKSYEHTKRYHVVFYYDENSHFHSKRVSWLKAQFYKTQVCKQMTRLCTICKKDFTILVRKNQIPECPNCINN